ncbi:hypothetical protein BH11VER1_BH11VER1_04390 [soil metagenome]
MRRCVGKVPHVRKRTAALHGSLQACGESGPPGKVFEMQRDVVDKAGTTPSSLRDDLAWYDLTVG